MKIIISIIYFFIESNFMYFWMKLLIFPTIPLQLYTCFAYWLRRQWLHQRLNILWQNQFCSWLSYIQSIPWTKCACTITLPLNKPPWHTNRAKKKERERGSDVGGRRTQLSQHTKATKWKTVLIRPHRHRQHGSLVPYLTHSNFYIPATDWYKNFYHHVQLSQVQ